MKVIDTRFALKRQLMEEVEEAKRKGSVDTVAGCRIPTIPHELCPLRNDVAVFAGTGAEYEVDFVKPVGMADDERWNVSSGIGAVVVEMA